MKYMEYLGNMQSRHKSTRETRDDVIFHCICKTLGKRIIAHIYITSNIIVCDTTYTWGMQSICGRYVMLASVCGLGEM